MSFYCFEHKPEANIFRSSLDSLTHCAAFFQVHLLVLCGVLEAFLRSSVKMKCYVEEEDKGNFSKIVLG